MSVAESCWWAALKNTSHCNVRPSGQTDRQTDRQREGERERERGRARAGGQE